MRFTKEEAQIRRRTNNCATVTSSLNGVNKSGEKKRNTDHDFPPPFMWAENNKTPAKRGIVCATLLLQKDFMRQPGFESTTYSLAGGRAAICDSCSNYTVSKWII